jgi:hypothetical protein
MGYQTCTAVIPQSKRTKILHDLSFNFVRYSGIDKTPISVYNSKYSKAHTDRSEMTEVAEVSVGRSVEQ